MQISDILNYIDNGYMALPEFQRGYVWGREQVRGLFHSLYRGHPVGSLLVWATDASTATHRGKGELAPGVVKLLLDGQQRITSLYGVIRGTPPRFFDGNARAFTDLRFNIETEEFEFFQPIKMRDDPLWIDVTGLMQAGAVGFGRYFTTFAEDPALATKIVDYIGRLNRLLAIREKNFHIEEVTGADKTIDVVVDIFNRVNSGGTKLSKGDLALAKICADWPEARSKMNASIATWKAAGYDFTIDWLLRSVNTVLTGEAKFAHLASKTAPEVQAGLDRAIRHIDKALKLIAGRLGLDHDRVLFARFAIPVMVRYFELHGSQMDEKSRDKLLFWYVQSGMWGRYSASTESTIDRDLEILEAAGNLDGLIEELRRTRGALRVEPSDFHSWSVASRFYPVLYMMTRMMEAKDWGDGIALTKSHLGRMNALEVHHIFPRARLYDAGYARSEVNALGNFCFQTKETNLKIRDRLPSEYLAEVLKDHSGALASQWVPDDPELWKVENYRAFIEKRKQLLAAAANSCLESLLHGNADILSGYRPAAEATPLLLGGIASDIEAAELDKINAWVVGQGYAKGVIGFEIVDPTGGGQRAVLDLAWPEGLQMELTEPVALLLGESRELISQASAAGFRCFTTPDGLRGYVEALATGGATRVAAE